MDLNDLRSRNDLKDLLAGLADVEIMALARELGVERVLERVFAVCEQVYDPQNGPRRRAVVCWDIGADNERHRWFMVADRTTMMCTSDWSSRPTLTATLDLPVFLRVMARLSPGVVEVASGRLRFRGNPTTALALDSWFPEG